MQWRRIVDAGLDPPGLQCLAQPIAVLGLDDEQVVDMPALRARRRDPDGHSLQVLPVGVRQVLAARVPAVQVGQLHPEYGGLDGIEPVIEGQADVLVLRLLAVVAQLADRVGHHVLAARRR